MLLPMLFLKGLELTLAGSMIAVIALMLRSMGRKWLSPRMMCWIWCLLLLKLLLPVTYTSAISIENWSDPYLYGDKYGASRWLLEAGKGWSGLRESLVPIDETTTAYKEMRMYQNGEEALIWLPAVKPEQLESLRVHSGMLEVQSAMAVIWLVGSIAAGGLYWWKSRGVRRWIRTAIPSDNAKLHDLLINCCKEAGVRRQVQLKYSALPYPALTGLRRPVILLPYDAEKLYCLDELRLIILHELMHYKQQDILLLRLAHIVRLLHWFNPLIGLALRRYEEDLEMRCDWRVLRRLTREEGRGYGLLLVRQGELNRGLTLTHGPGAYWLSHQRHLKQRVQHIVAWISRAGELHPRWLRLSSGFAITLLLAVALLPGSNLYDVLRSMQTPTLYAYWLEEEASPRDKEVLDSMAAQIAGIPVDQSQVQLIYQDSFRASSMQHAWNRVHLLVESEEHPWPLQVDVRPVRSAMRERGMREGRLLLMLHYPQSSIKGWGFSTGKGIMADLTSLELLDYMNVY